MEGLVDCGSSTEFYDKLEACKPMWELLRQLSMSMTGLLNTRAKLRSIVCFKVYDSKQVLVYAQGVIKSIKYQLKHRMICALGMRSGTSLLPLVIHHSREDLAMPTTTHVVHVLGVDGHMCNQGISLLPAHQMFLAEHLGLYA